MDGTNKRNEGGLPDIQAFHLQDTPCLEPHLEGNQHEGHLEQEGPPAIEITYALSWHPLSLPADNRDSIQIIRGMLSNQRYTLDVYASIQGNI